MVAKPLLNRTKLKLSLKKYHCIVNFVNLASWLKSHMMLALNFVQKLTTKEKHDR